jgi:hypothetical protein
MVLAPLPSGRMTLTLYGRRAFSTDPYSPLHSGTIYRCVEKIGPPSLEPCTGEPKTSYLVSIP